MYIKKFERALMKSSFSCDLFKKNNNFTQGVDGSRECHYDKCNYQCDVKQDNIVDLSTYRPKYHNKEAYSYITGVLKNLFDTYKVLTISDINKIVNLGSDLETILDHDRPFPIVKQGKYYSIPKDKITNIKGKTIKSVKPKEYRGFLENGVFKLSTGTKTGTVCTSFSKPQLLNICQQLNIVVDNKLKKTELCNLLATKLNV
jgi:hypothetical protein